MNSHDRKKSIMLITIYIMVVSIHFNALSQPGSATMPPGKAGFIMSNETPPRYVDEQSLKLPKACAVSPSYHPGTGGPAEALSVTIIESQSYNPGHNQDVIWQNAATGMGYTAVVMPQSTLDNTAFFSVTDILIISSGIISIPAGRRAVIQQWVEQGGPLYIQGEFLAVYEPNQTFLGLVNNLGGSFSWGSTTSGNLAPMNISGVMSTTPNSVPSISDWFWYGCTGSGNGTIQPFMHFSGSDYGFVFSPPNPSYGRIICNSDQDWARESIHNQALMQNILAFLSPPTASSLVLQCQPNTSRNNTPGYCHYTVAGTELDPLASGGSPPYTYAHDYDGGGNSLNGFDLPVGPNTVSWTVTDGNNSTASCLTVITVIDNAPPTIHCPNPLTLHTNDSSCTSDGHAYHSNCIPSPYCWLESTNDVIYSNTTPGPSKINHMRISNFLYCTAPPALNIIQEHYTEANASFDFYPQPNAQPVHITATAQMTIRTTNTGEEGDKSFYDTEMLQMDIDASDEGVIISVNSWSSSPGKMTIIQLANGYIIESFFHVATLISVDGGVTWAMCDNKMHLRMTTLEAPPGFTNTDNCSNGAAALRSDGAAYSDPWPHGVTTVTWVATDQSGNTASCSYTITVIDNVKPHIICPPSQTVTADPQTCSYSPAFGGTVSDNCQMASIVAIPSSIPIGTSQVTFLATDVHNNTSSCWQVITVVDDEKPVITCPTVSTIYTDLGCTGSQQQIGQATASDECSGATPVISVSPAGPYAVGTHTVTWKAMDAYGNSATCHQTFTVQDNVPPEIICATPDMHYFTDPGTCTYTVKPPPGTYLDPLSYSDNCGVSSVKNNQTGTHTLNGFTFPKGTTTVVWTVTDQHGLTATCSYNVNVSDNQPPSISCPDNKTVTNDPGQCGAVVFFDIPVVTDNCPLIPSGALNAYTFWGTYGGHSYYGSNATATYQNAYNAARASGGHLVTISNTGENGFLASASGGLTLYWTGGSDAAEEGKWIWATGEPFSYTNWAFPEPNNWNDEDYMHFNWSNPGQWNDYDPVPYRYIVEFDGLPLLTTSKGSGSFFPVGTTTVAYMATDLSGNTATCSFTVTVTDDEPPLVVCPVNHSLCAPSDQNSAVLDGLIAQVADNCGSSGNTAYFFLVSGATSRIGWTANASGPFNVGYNLVTFTITDDAGNMSDCSFTVEIYKHTTADAGPDISSCSGIPVYVKGNIPTHGSMLWEQLSGPTTAAIAQPANYATYISNLAVGTYEFRYTITHGFCSSTDEMQITVGTGPGQANAGPDQVYCGSTGSAVMAATPPPSGMGMWSQMSGPTTVSISNLFNPAATIGNLGTGIYVMKWAVSSGSCNPSIDYMNITVKPAMTVNAGPDVLLAASAPSYYIAGSSAINYNSLGWTRSGTGFFNNATILHPTYYPSAADKTLGFVDLSLTGYQAGCQQKSDLMRITFKKDAELDPEATSFTVTVIPNPFCDEANIEFTLPEAGHLSMKIIDMNGRIVGLPADQFEVREASLTRHIKAAGMAPGIYSWYAVLDGRDKHHFQSGRFVIAR